ncbi:MAG TPA: response regulator [Planctomycetaceae bacterium]|nr:response regulator [Planctomycetaceae bacterium]
MDVLVVDDDTVVRQAVSQTLQAAGYHVALASDGQPALDLLERHGQQLVVSDWSMPGMGLSCAEPFDQPTCGGMSMSSC